MHPMGRKNHDGTIAGKGDPFHSVQRSSYPKEIEKSLTG